MFYLLFCNFYQSLLFISILSYHFVTFLGGEISYFFISKGGIPPPLATLGKSLI